MFENNQTDLKKEYLLKLGGFMEVLTADVPEIKESLGANETRLIKAGMAFEKSPNDLDTIRAVESALDNLRVNSSHAGGEVRPFKELRDIYAQATGMELKESVYSTNYSTLVPEIIAGGFIDNEEMEYIGSQIMPTKRVDASNVQVEFYAHSPLVANWSGEGQRGSQKVIELTPARKLTVNVRPYEITLGFTRDTLKQAVWPVLDMHVTEAQRAMRRFREEWIWEQFESNAKTLFDPTSANSAFHTSGVDGTYSSNNTMSVYDFLDLVASLFLRKFKPTDIMMHPLHYLVFVKTAMRGGLFLPEANKAAIASGFSPDASTQQNFISGQLGGLIPNVWTTPFVPFDVRHNLAHVYVIDRQNVGVVLEREGIRRIDWQDLGRDMSYIRFKDEMGVSIFNEGDGISAAKNISTSVGYNMDISFVYNLGN